ncbi:MAG: Uma2 family endonuclease [Halanaerobiales bacterium]|nr:Uma2 family endonuclease [Halanaerobiales bacterium]
MSENRRKGGIVSETSPKHRYTYGDYLTWDDAQRYELIDGSIYVMSPAPGRRHQEVAGEFHRQLANYLLEKECAVYIAPFDVRLPEREKRDEDIATVVQPDLVIVCDDNKLDERGCKGAPDLVIEIILPGSAGRDRKTKRELYQKHGVLEYWIVDEHQSTVEVYLLNAQKQYGKPEIYTTQERLPVSIFSDLAIDLKMVFKA